MRYVVGLRCLGRLFLSSHIFFSFYARFNRWIMCTSGSFSTKYFRQAQLISFLSTHCVNFSIQFYLYRWHLCIIIILTTVSVLVTNFPAIGLLIWYFFSLYLSHIKLLVFITVSYTHLTQPTILRV